MRKIILTAFASAVLASGAISAASAQVPYPYTPEPYMQTDRGVPVGPQRYDPRYDPQSTGSVVIMDQGPVGPGLWPTCTAGPPTCTAAGYPNLRYMREGAY